MKPFEPSGTFLAVSDIGDPICAIKADGTLSCWSWNSTGFDLEAGEVPSGTFTSVSAGKKYACAVKTEGTLACWGDNTYGQATAPAGTFSAVATRSRHSCGIKTDGTVTCWGDNTYGQAAAPVGTFLSLTLTEWASCGMKTDGSLSCWGSGASSMTSKNTGLSVAFPIMNVWTLGADGGISCRDAYSFYPGCPAGRFQTLLNGYNSVCAINAAGFPVCWGGLMGMTP